MHEKPARHRFFAPDLSSPTVVLGDGEAHHALHVLRLKTGQAVELFDGRGRWAQGRIASAGRREVAVAIGAPAGPAEPPQPRIHLAVAPPKGKRLDWLLEKAAELSAASVRMLRCARSVVTPEGAPSALRRCQAVCVSAIRQSRQLWLPEIPAPAELRAFVRPGPRGRGIIAHAGPHTPALRTLELPRPPSELTVLIGPEGGWTPEELDLARQSGFAPARLGCSVLRTETAAIALVAALRALLEPPTVEPSAS